ncbi:hypothetical protein B0H67DRAFT_638249 [Lasiosphaeris hirsuta]|uniref:Uncharacterized protein n=1 Tax=Lasiosphaeris hirsuta TaxID=260670 RepID=A0AA40B8J8_9PEZI|nr:hypothetical protein B0H67DRAFT_638249 [Lasiosphaeris hirsuta]
MEQTMNHAENPEVAEPEPRRPKYRSRATGIPRGQYTEHSHPIACELPSVQDPTVQCTTRFVYEYHHRTHRQAIHGVYRPGEMDAIIFTTSRSHLQRINKPSMAAMLVHQRAVWNNLKAAVLADLVEAYAWGPEFPEALVSAIAAVDLQAPDASTAVLNPRQHSKAHLTDSLIEIRTLWRDWALLKDELEMIGFGHTQEPQEGLEEES